MTPDNPDNEHLHKRRAQIEAEFKKLLELHEYLTRNKCYQETEDGTAKADLALFKKGVYYDLWMKESYEELTRLNDDPPSLEVLDLQAVLYMMARDVLTVLATVIPTRLYCSAFLATLPAEQYPGVQEVADKVAELHGYTVGGAEKAAITIRQHHIRSISDREKLDLDKDDLQSLTPMACPRCNGPCHYSSFSECRRVRGADV